MEGIEPGDVFFIKVISASGDDSGRPRRRGIPGDWHPFSVVRADPDRLGFLIRQLGDFTGSLSTLPVGARIAFQGPYGRFGRIAEAGDGRPLVLVGMGAGAAPLLSLLDAHAANRPVHLLWSLRPTDLGAARGLVERYGGTSRLTLQDHRFTAETLASELDEAAKTEGQFFIVGPPRAVLAMRRTLRRLGVPRARLHDERLTM
ncbi:hypothetical protein [[Pseudopropionibacterium] massiliense]|uniref:hypothetical protein n=1 Tax=[Pseudopropionibacterium] massiliense TaxID=2220000 RepID=UPI0010304D2D|nr:hypothetical protein [[Pseudopropionibacterium] massiliense]